MVLDLDQGQASSLGALLRIAGRQVIRVQVAGNSLGLNAEQALEMADAFFEGAQGFIIFQIADMVAEKGIVLAGQAEGVF